MGKIDCHEKAAPQVGRGSIHLDLAIIHKAKTDGTTIGDMYFVSSEAPWLLVVADGLGAGEKARGAANIPIELARDLCLDPSFATENSREKMFNDFFLNCHQKLKRSRGAVVAGVVLDPTRQLLTFCGVGNVRLVIAGGKSKYLSSHPGIVGVQMPRRITTSQISTEEYATGFLFSDGISLRSVLRAAAVPHRPVQLLADEIDSLNGNADDRTLLVFSILT